MIMQWKVGFLAVVTLAVGVGCGSPKADRTGSTENSSTNTGTPLDLPGDLTEIKQKVDDLKTSIDEILANFDFNNLLSSLTSMTPADLQNILDDLKAAGVDLDELIAEVQNQISTVGGQADLPTLTELEQLLTELKSSQATVDDLIELITGFLGN